MEYTPDPILEEVDELLDRPYLHDDKLERLRKAAQLMLMHPYLGLAWDAESSGERVYSIAATNTRIPVEVGEVIEALDEMDERGYSQDHQRCIRDLHREVEAWYKRNFRELLRADVLPASRLDLLAAQIKIMGTDAAPIMAAARQGVKNRSNGGTHN